MRYLDFEALYVYFEHIPDKVMHYVLDNFIQEKYSKHIDIYYYYVKDLIKNR